MPFCSPSTSLRFFPSGHIPFPLTTPIRRRHLFITSSFPPLRHPTRRRNHLRSKLHQSLIILPPRHPYLEELPRHLQQEEEEEEEDERRNFETDGWPLEPKEEVQVENEKVLVSEIVHQEKIVVKRKSFDALKLFLNGSMCLAAVLAVQTVWTVGRAFLEQKESSFGDGKEKVRFVLEDDGKMEEIRTMAREVRLRQVQEEEMARLDDFGKNELMSEVRQEVETRLDRMKTRVRMELLKKGNADAVVGKKIGGDGVRRKLALKKMKVDIMNRNKPKGFNNSARNKKVSSKDLLPNGDIQQIDHDIDVLKESPDMHKRSVEYVDGAGDASSVVNSIDLSVFPLEQCSDTKYPRISVQNSTDTLRSNEDVSVTGFGNDTRDHQVKVYPSEKSRTSKQNNNLRKHSRVKSNSQVVKAAKSQCLNENKLGQVFQSRNSNSLPAQEKYESAVQPNIRRELWWLKLPYVLGIFLRKGPGSENQEDLKGLYSLKIDSNSKDSISCAIVFQDLGDATNLSYLLESYFEELGDVTADIVPMPVQALEDAVRKKSLNVTVVRKGQLRLYVGQPLTEVEIALRSIMDSEHYMSDDN